MFAVIEDGRDVVTIDHRAGVRQQVFRSDGRLTDLTVSPSQEYVAVVEHSLGGPRRLRVLTTSGRAVLESVLEVQRYVWCGGSCVATVEGAVREGGVGFVPGSVIVLDVSAGRHDTVSAPPGVYQLAWAPFDSAVYLKTLTRTAGGRVFRYDLVTRTVSPTPYLHLDFSPAGRYYLYPVSEDNDRTRLFDVRTNTEIPLPDSAQVGVPVRWLFDHGNYLLMVRVKPLPDEARGRFGRVRSRVVERVIYDVSSRKVVGRVAGEIEPWAAPRGYVPVRAGGRVQALTGPP
ncbi:MAG: hypothetical protein ACREMJ_00420 [Gemmatimonadales bacterium]